MSDLTDNEFYPFAERIWLCIRFNKAGKWACDRLTEDADFGKRNHLFRWSSFWSWLVCKQAKLSHLKTHMHTLKSRRTKTSYEFENEQEEAVTVNGDRYRSVLNEFFSTKIEKEDIGNIWFQQDGAMCHTAEATLDILCALFLKISLLAAELMSFGHFGAAIWHLCIIIFGVGWGQR